MQVVSHRGSGMSSILFYATGGWGFFGPEVSTAQGVNLRSPGFPKWMNPEGGGPGPVHVGVGGRVQWELIEPAGSGSYGKPVTNGQGYGSSVTCNVDCPACSKGMHSAPLEKEL